MKLTEYRLRQLLSYDELTGAFTWLVYRGGFAKAGFVAGTIQRSGYLQIEIDGHGYKAHRLAWLYVTGQWPKSQIDHKDGIKTNNRFANLREATNQSNQENKYRAQSNNQAGVLGVGKKPDRGGHRARITVDGKTINLGRFKTPAEAYARYVEAKRELHCGCLL